MDNDATTHPSTFPSDSPLTFLIEICGVLKRLKRQGWIHHKVPYPESDADHMHRVALASMLYHNNHNETDLDYSNCPQFHPSKIDATKLLRMALTHDICEALAGDVTPHCPDAASRVDREREAMDHIKRIVGGPLGDELANLWREYEEQETPIAMVVKDLDKFEMLVQAFEYEDLHLNARSDATDPLQQTPRSMNHSLDMQAASVGDEPLRDFFQRQKGKLRTPLFQKLDAELRQKRVDMLEGKGWKVTPGEM